MKLAELKWKSQKPLALIGLVADLEFELEGLIFVYILLFNNQSSIEYSIIIISHVSDDWGSSSGYFIHLPYGVITIKLAFHSRIKHIEIHVHFLWEKVDLFQLKIKQQIYLLNLSFTLLNSVSKFLEVRTGAY